MARYVALVDGVAGAYGVTMPDLPGCTSGGSTTDEALRNAIEGVRIWAEDAIADGDELPVPRSAETLRGDPEVAAAIAGGAALAIVPLLIDLGRPTKANLSIDVGLRAAIDEAAAARGLTRSAFLAGAAREKIEKRRMKRRLLRPNGPATAFKFRLPNLLDHLSGKAVSSVPKLANRTPFAFVVDAFLMRTADYAPGHRDR